MFKVQDIVGPGIHALADEKNKFLYDCKLQKLETPLESKGHFFELTWLQYLSPNNTVMEISSFFSNACFACWNFQAVFDTKDEKDKVDAKLEIFDKDNKTLAVIDHVCCRSLSIDTWACFSMSIMEFASGYRLLWSKTNNGTIKIINNNWKLFDFQWICNPIRRRSLSLTLDRKRSILSDMTSFCYLVGSLERNEKWTRRLINMGICENQIKSVNLLPSLTHTAEQKTHQIKALKIPKCENIAWMFTDYCEPNPSLTWSTWEQECWALYNSFEQNKHHIICFSGQYPVSCKEEDVPIPTSPLHPINMSTMFVILPWDLYQQDFIGGLAKKTLAQWLTLFGQHVVRPNVSLVEYCNSGI